MSKGRDRGAAKRIVAQQRAAEKRRTVTLWTTVAVVAVLVAAGLVGWAALAGQDDRTVTTPAAAVDELDVRDALLRLAGTEPEAFCHFLYELGLDLKGAVYRHSPAPYARAAREAGFAMDDVALRYGREADRIAGAAGVAESTDGETRRG